MSFTDRAKAGPPATTAGKPCSIGHLLESLPDHEADALRDMIADPAWGHAALERLIRDDEGHKIGKQSVQHHRAGDCRCSR